MPGGSITGLAVSAKRLLEEILRRMVRVEIHPRVGPTPQMEGSEVEGHVAFYSEHTRTAVANSCRSSRSNLQQTHMNNSSEAPNACAHYGHLQLVYGFTGLEIMLATESGCATRTLPEGHN